MSSPAEESITPARSLVTSVALPDVPNVSAGALLDLDDPIAERLYVHLAKHPGDTVVESAHALGISELACERAGGVLVSHRVAERCGAGSLRVLPPHSAARGRLARLEDELSATKDLLESVNDEYVRARSRAAGSVFLAGADEIVPIFIEGQERAQEQVRGIMKPPFLSGSHSNKEIQTRRIGDGVRYRSIYDDSIMQDRRRVDELMIGMDLGCDVRILHNAPLKLIIFDDVQALAIFPSEALDQMQMMVVGPSGLLDAFGVLFESLFAMSLSLEGAASEEHADDEVDRELLGLMASGFTDAAIARHWNVSTRTVERRISVVMQHLGVSSRFQAGLAARSRGWI